MAESSGCTRGSGRRISTASHRARTSRRRSWAGHPDGARLPLVTRREPTSAQTRSSVCCVARRSASPSARRPAHLHGRPESVQGLIAAGLLGAGGVFLGPAMTRPSSSPARCSVGAEPDKPLRDAAEHAVRHAGARERAGLGHPVHRSRTGTTRLYELAEQKAARPAAPVAAAGCRRARRGVRQAPADQQRRCRRRRSPTVASTSACRLRAHRGPPDSSATSPKRSTTRSAYLCGSRSTCAGGSD